MRIAFLTLEYPPAGGGIASSLATVAPALVSRGHEVRVVGWCNTQRSETDRGVTVELDARTKLPKLGWWLNPLRVERRLRRLVKSGSLDIVIAHDWCAPSARIFPGCKVLVWCNGSATYFADLAGEQVRPSVARAERRALGRAHAVAAASAYTAARTQVLFSLEEQPTVLHNPVDTERFQPAESELIERETLLYFGTIVRKKGVLEVCEAFNRVVQQVPTARLVLAGRDSRDSATGEASTWNLCWEILTAEARLRTDYLGFVPYERIEALIQTCSAAVLPSHAEALPLAWMEVMACARPVVALHIGWAPELVRSGVDGLLVTGGDVEQLSSAMVDLLHNPEGADALGLAARARMVEKFSADVVAAEFEAWIEKALRT